MDFSFYGSNAKNKMAGFATNRGKSGSIASARQGSVVHSKSRGRPKLVWRRPLTRGPFRVLRRQRLVDTADLRHRRDLRAAYRQELFAGQPAANVAALELAADLAAQRRKPTLFSDLILCLPSFRCEEIGTTGQEQTLACHESGAIANAPSRAFESMVRSSRNSKASGKEAPSTFRIAQGVLLKWRTVVWPNLPPKSNR